MLIDWFTVGAQTLNFLILVWLMKRYLYQPVLDAIDAREKRTASELSDAAQKQVRADKERDEFKTKNVAFDQQREALARKASAEVDVERQRLLTDARTQADAMRAKRHEALEVELQTMQQEIARRSQEEVFAIARRVLSDLAGVTLEERVTEIFCQRLHAMNAQAKGELARALQGLPGVVRVRSAFDLTASQRAAIGQALNAAMEANLSIQFETTPEVISGIELSANGWKIAWNIADFLTSLQQHIGEPIESVKDTASATP